MQGTLDTVQKLTGIPVNYLITLNFHGFKLIVNKLHGVYMNVDHRYYIPPNTGTATINLEPGYQKLDGQDALNLLRIGLRSRKGGRGLGQDLDQAKLTHLTTYRATAAMS